jgi:hypothetical protein
MSESKDDNGNFYYYTNKGREYTFNLDDLTTEELIKFEKMTEKQRLRFIANFELQKDSPFTDTVSLKPVADEARNEKYNTYALLKAKINECDKLIKLDAKEGADEPDKVSILDNNKQVLPKYLDNMTHITGDDIKNCMFAFDLNDVSLGMLKKYYNRLIDGLDIGGLKKAFLENLKKIYRYLYDQEQIRNKKTYTKRDKQPTKRQLEYEEKLEEIADLLRQIATNKGNITTEQIEDQTMETNDLLIQQIKSNIRENNIEFKEDEQEILDESFKQKVLTDETIKMLKDKENEELNKLVEQYETNKKMFADIPPMDETSTETIEKEEEIIKTKEEEPKTEEPKTEEEEPKTEEEIEDEGADDEDDYKLENIMPGIKDMFIFIATVRDKLIAMGKPYTEQRIKEAFPVNLPGYGNKTINNSSTIPSYIYSNRNSKNNVIITIRKEVGNGDYYRIFIYYKNLTANFTSTMKTIEITDDNENKTITYNTSNQNRASKRNKITITVNGNTQTIDVTHKVYGLGYKTTFTSGSLIDKIRNKFLKSINTDIDNLKSKDKSIESRLDDIMNEIKDIKTKLNSQSQQSIPQPPPFKPQPPKPQSQQPSFLDDIIKQPRLKPSKPIYHPPEEESDISKILAERRKDIEYSESDESDEEWGEGIQTKKIKLSEFLKKFN